MIPRRSTAGNEAGAALAVLVLAASPAVSAAPPEASPIASQSPANPYEVRAAPHADSLARLVAMHYGAAQFHRVGALHYTYRVRLDGKDIERRWTWHPHEDSVSYRGKDPGGLPVQAAWSRRNRFSVESPAVLPLDKWFVNDQYWLLFPFHLVWDKGVRLESAASPGGGEVWRLTATYPPEGGYTPGDAYDLFLDRQGYIQRWVFRKGNSRRPTRDVHWSPPVQVGPLRLSLERNGMDGKFRIRFTDIRVDLRGETPKPAVSAAPEP